MWKTVRACERFAVRFKDASNWKRTFLSNEYRCDEAWKSRLASPLLEKVDLENAYLTLNQKYNQIGKAHAIDIDIFANAIREGGHELDELSDLLYKLRLSTETSNTLESTHYAVIRCFLEADRVEDLLNILHDRLNYGIFPDNPALNILMDALIKKKDYASAARVGVLPMLQEDVENPISNTLAIYSCHMYLKNPDGWKEREPEVDESKEEIKVRIKFLRNSYFDDHFDLQKPAHLVGKTLSFYGKYLGDSLGRTYQLLGLTLYEKYATATGLIKEWIRNGVKQVLYKEGLELVKTELSKIPESEINEDIRAFNKEIESLEKADLIEGSLDEAIENRVKEAVGLQAEKDISSQCQVCFFLIKRNKFFVSFIYIHFGFYFPGLH